MKKYILLVFALICFLAAQAQETTTTSEEPVVLKSKRGINILPEAGEWGLGISANPLFNYTGNFFNGTNNNVSPGFNYANNPVNQGNPANAVGLFGKYMVDANTAYRVRFNLGIGTQVDKGVIAQNEIAPDANYPAFTEDFRKTSSQTIMLAAGYEKRRGKSRVQGIYGGEVVLGYTGAKQTYEYGNEISLDFNNPNTYNFGTNVLANGRVVEQKTGAAYYAGVRGFIGVEYFIAPRVSIGGEFGYSVAFRSASRTLMTSERWDANSNSVKQVKNDIGTPGNYFTFVGASLDNLSGAINLLFYF